jgi:glycosyltransferase involved in cell wall biosynthesis
MKILHLFSNVKLTGPAEPAISLCASLKQAGHDVMFACSAGKSSVEKVAISRGLEPITRFRLNKHLRIKDNIHDLRKLPSFLRENQVRMVHAHLDNDHLLGGRASRSADQGILVVRSCYSGDGMRSTLRNRYLLGRLTDGLVVASESARKSILENFRFPERRIWIVPGAVDTDRFNESNVTANFRPQFGLDEGDFVFGVVARIQPHRRFDVILEAMKMVLRTTPAAKLLIVGRGTRMRQVAVEPVEQMGLGGCVRFAGYQTGQDYVNTLACFDAMIFLMPGTDGTCRAVREAMAMGKPVVAARRGMLPEIVDHARNGFVIEDTPSSLAEAMRYLVNNPEVVASMSTQALKKARKVFQLNSQAREVGSIYEQIAGMGCMAKSGD